VGTSEEILAPLTAISPLETDPNVIATQKDLQLLFSTVIGGVAGGAVDGDEGVVTGADIAAIGETNNRGLHQDEENFLKRQEIINGFINKQYEETGKQLTYDEAAKIIEEGGTGLVSGETTLFNLFKYGLTGSYGELYDAQLYILSQSSGETFFDEYTGEMTDLFETSIIGAVVPYDPKTKSLIAQIEQITGVTDFKKQIEDGDYSAAAIVVLLEFGRVPKSLQNIVDKYGDKAIDYIQTNSKELLDTIKKLGDKEVIVVDSNGKPHIINESDLEDWNQPNVNNIEGDGGGTSTGGGSGNNTPNIGNISSLDDTRNYIQNTATETGRMNGKEFKVSNEDELYNIYNTLVKDSTISKDIIVKGEAAKMNILSDGTKVLYRESTFGGKTIEVQTKKGNKTMTIHIED